MKNSKVILFTFMASLVVAGCSAEQVPNASSVPITETSSLLESVQTEVPNQTTVPTESVSEKDSSGLQYDERLTFEQAFTFYIGRQSVDWGHYSIAPAGTDECVPLRFTGQCEDRKREHDPWYYSQYQIPYEGSECTKWRIKSEFLPDDPFLAELFPDAEYSCTVWEDVEIINGETVLLIKVSEEDGSHYFDAEPMPEKYCEECLVGFGLEMD